MAIKLHQKALINFVNLISSTMADGCSQASHSDVLNERLLGEPDQSFFINLVA